MKLLLCSIIHLHEIFMSCHHLIAWVSKVAFIISGSAWSCNFVLPLCCQQPSSCIHCIRCVRWIHCVHCIHCIWCVWYAAFRCCSWCCLLRYLDILVYEQLDIFMSRQSYRHLIDCISKCSLNGVFDSTLLETIVPAPLRGRWTHAIPDDMATLMESNLLVENQNGLEN